MSTANLLTLILQLVDSRFEFMSKLKWENDFKQLKRVSTLDWSVEPTKQNVLKWKKKTKSNQKGQQSLKILNTI